MLLAAGFVLVSNIVYLFFGCLFPVLLVVMSGISGLLFSVATELSPLVTFSSETCSEVVALSQ